MSQLIYSSSVFLLGITAQSIADSDELIAQGSPVIVPCLRIEEGVEVKWFYESNDIVQCLNTRFD